MNGIKILVNGDILVGNTHQRLLDQLEAAGYQPEYQCRNGLCGVCRCQLKQGEVKKEDTMAFIAQNEILTCCATPLENVEIVFNYQLASNAPSIIEAPKKLQLND